jgi:hypothetical protein
VAGCVPDTHLCLPFCVCQRWTTTLTARIRAHPEPADGHGAPGRHGTSYGMAALSPRVVDTVRDGSQRSSRPRGPSGSPPPRHSRTRSCLTSSGTGQNRSSALPARCPPPHSGTCRPPEEHPHRHLRITGISRMRAPAHHAESDAGRLCRPHADRLVRSPWMRSRRRSACRP